MTATRSAVARRADEAGLGKPGRSSGVLSVVDLRPLAPTTTVVPLARLAPDPTNVREAAGLDIDGLVDTIRAKGIYQALIVCTSTAYNREHPDTPVAESQYDYVVLDGHRRREAAFPAGLGHVPVAVHNEHAGASKTMLQLITGMHARSLSHLDLGEGIVALRAENKDLTQSDVIRLLGLRMTQPTVGRYEKLVTYPDFIKDLLRTEKITMADAGHLATLADTPDAMHRAYDLIWAGHEVAATAVETVRADLARQANAAASARRLETGKVPVVDPAGWGSKAEFHLQAHGDLPRAVEREHKGCLAAAVSEDDGLIDWYCTDLERHGLLDDATEASRARVHRRQAAVELATTWQGSHAATHDIIDSLLASARPGTPVRLALSWAVQAGLIPDDVAKSGDQAEVLGWARRELSTENRVRFARMLVLGHDEAAARSTDWSARQATYLTRLHESSSYVPTPWEIDRCNRLAEASGDLA